jgi:hypothetical protein
VEGGDVSNTLFGWLPQIGTSPFKSWFTELRGQEICSEPGMATVAVWKGMDFH